MSRKAVQALAQKRKQIPRIFRKQRNRQSAAEHNESTTTENVLAASVKLSDDHEVREEEAHQDMSKFQNDKVAQHQSNVHSSKAVEEIEIWLRNASETISNAGMNVENNSRASVESYLTEQLPEVFFEKDPLAVDVDLIAKKLLAYDTSLEELHNDRLSPGTEKDVFLLPELQLDNLDQLAYCEDDTILPGENLSFTSVQSVCNNFNANFKDSVEAQNYSIEKQRSQDVNKLENYVNENLDDASLPTGVKDLSLESMSYNKSVVSNSTSCKNLKKKATCNKTFESASSALQNSVQLRSKNSYVKGNVSLSRAQSVGVKLKFQPTIIKRKKKTVHREDSYNNEKNTTRSVISASTDKQSNAKKRFLNASKYDEISKNQSLKYNIRTRKRSSSESHESEQEENIRIRPISYYNHQELVIAKALEEVGITDKKLKHAITEDNYKIWICHQDECDRQFAKLCSLKAHLLTHFGIKPFKCDYEGCSWAFYTDFKLKRHKETHLKKKDYVCSIPGCKRRFTTIYNLASHEKLHTRPNRVTCQVPDCNAKFQTKRALEIHMKTHDESLAPYVCNYEGCGKRYYGSNALMSHQRCHSYSEIDVTCSWPGCGKTFDQPCRLKAHMRSHTGCKPYACSFKGCKWAFSTSSKLKRHQKKHTNDRKFVCDIADCHKAFMRSEHLKEHKLTHAEERFFKCHVCAAAFSAKSSLYVHIKKHANEFNSRTQRQPKKTVEKKIVSKKKEVYCSRVQPVRIAANKTRKKSLTPDSVNTEQEAMKDINKLVEEDENVRAIKAHILSNPTVEDKTSKNIYLCPVDYCANWYPNKSNLRLHLQKEHITPLSEIQNNSVTHVVPPSPHHPQQDLIVYNVPQCSVNKLCDQMITTQYEQDFLEDPPQAMLPIKLKVHSTLQNTETSLTQEVAVDQTVMKNEGSARTAFTREKVFSLKPSRKLVDSSVGASDVVLGAAGCSESLLMPDDLPSIYCQEDIEVPEYQILLLDSGPTDSEISMRDLE